MSEHDALAYRGDVSPSSLPGPIVLRPVPLLWFPIAFVLGFASFCVLIIGLGAVVLVADPLRPIDLSPLLLITATAGLVVGVRSFLRVRGLEVTVGPERITVTRDSIVVQDCRWDQTTVSTRGGLIRRHSLADQHGNVFPLGDLMQASPTDNALVSGVIRTRVCQLKPPVEAIPPVVRRRWWAFGGASVLALVVGMNLLNPAALRFQELVGDPSASAAQRTGALLVVIFLGVLVALATFGVTFMLLPFERWMNEKMRAKHSELTEFISQRQGVLEAVTMKPRVRYRYVVPDQLRANDGGIVAGWIAILVGIGIAALCFALALYGRTEDRLLAVLCGIAFLGLLGPTGWYSLHRSRLLRRGLPCEFVMTGSGAIEVHQDGQPPFLYVLARKSKSQRDHRSHLGQVWWLLQVQDRQKLLVDPRYLIPASTDDPQFVPSGE